MFRASDGLEPDDSAPNATPLSLEGASYQHSLTGNDVDWHRLLLTQESEIALSASAALADESQLSDSDRTRPRF